MKKASLIKHFGSILLLALALVPAATAEGGWTLIGWNDLGMHCMDADFSVLAILPPYNTIHAQLIDPNGRLVADPAGITVTYQAVADLDGSYNSTSGGGKTNFWDYVMPLFNAALAPDQGLAAFDMPGVSNTPQAMHFDAGLRWFTAEGIPLTPYDDSGRKNPYPLMRLVARDASGNVLATTDIVLPVSDEMSCRDCHSSSSGPAAEPVAGWVNNANPELDYRLNVLLLHDQYQVGDPAFAAALVAAGYDPLGLYATATSAGRPVLCADCHGSNALPGTGLAGIAPLTQAIHSRHAGVVDPNNGMTLGSSANRSACYTCHPGSETRCLRGAMGHAVAADGSLAMQCQSCHGDMSTVGDASRQGWFDEPTCQQCHSGTATRNNGQIRYTSVFTPSGEPRVAVDRTFATNPDTPAPGVSLFRFSSGHGGLQCEACHGSTHAIFPSSHRNDNVQSVLIQNHVGTLVECQACHGSSPQTTDGGPHGMHPVGSAWVSRHGDQAEHSGTSGCRSCHGSDYRGTVLSRSAADRTISTEHGSKSFWRGFQIGCYTCHNGPSSESWNSNRAPVTADLSASTTAGVPVRINLVATDADGNALQLRVVTQPENGTVGLSNRQATYYPEGSFEGTARFTYAAWDGSTDSNLSTVTVEVGAGTPACELSCGASVPSSGDAGVPVAFVGTATATDCGGSPVYDWNFGDGTSHSSSQSPSHAYSAAGAFTWTLTVTLDGQSCVSSGTINVAAAPQCELSCGASVPSSGDAGVPVAFVGNATASNCGGSPGYDWDFGDGTSHSSSQSPSHTYSTAGAFTWTLTVTLDGQSCVSSGTINIAAAPSCTVTCSAEVATTATARLAVEFHGSAETHGCEGEPSYLWNFGDGSRNVTGKEVTHAYRKSGTYTWTLRVTVNGSQCDSSGVITVGSRTRRRSSGS